MTPRTETTSKAAKKLPASAQDAQIVGIRTPVIAVSPRGAARLRQGHVWVYRSDLGSTEGVSPGSLVQVQDASGHLLGTALYSSSSQIALRMISERALTAADWNDLFRRRVQDAIAYRKRVVRDSNAYRVIFSEADLLPGLIVDRYHDVLSIQVLTQAMDQEPMRELILGELENQLEPAAIVERVEPRIRELEQLPARESGLLRAKPGIFNQREAPGETENVRVPHICPTLADVGSKTPGDEEPVNQGKALIGTESGARSTLASVRTVIEMNGVRFAYDALAGQKTGAFLDQRENYAAAARHAPRHTNSRALDVFCYQGGFALHLARVCDQVTGVDSSRPALEAAERNAELNRVEVEWIEANAFDLMKDYASAGEQYDVIVVDPPAFAKTRRALDTALRGYKELNLRALKMLRPGGTLVSCSCSYHVSEAEFLEMLAAASVDAHRQLRILERRGAAQDHPVLLTVPETNYLKCIIAGVV